MLLGKVIFLEEDQLQNQGEKKKTRLRCSFCLWLIHPCKHIFCVSHAFEMDAAFYYFCYFQSIFIGQLIHLLEKKKTVNAALSITLSLIPFQMIVLLQCHNRKKMILFHTSRQRHQNRLSEKYCPFMNDNSESFEISTKHFTQQPQNMQLF